MYDIDFPGPIFDVLLNDGSKQEVLDAVKIMKNFMESVEAIATHEDFTRLTRQSIAWIGDIRSIAKKGGYQAEVAAILDDSFEITFSASKELSRKYNPYIIAWDEFYKILRFGGNYSPSQFINGHRISDQWVGNNNCIILDIDDGWTISDAILFLVDEGLMGLVATSKSHQKEKNGVVQDRFRVVVPTTKPFNGTITEYSNAMKNVFKFFLNKPDPACKDVSRMYYGNPDCEYFYVNPTGDKLDWARFKQKVKKLKKERIYEDSDIMKAVDALVDNLGGLREGARNNTLFRVAKWLDDNGKSESEIRNKLEELNSRSIPPLDQKEIDNLIKNL